ncbi:TAT-variant-translocated molybdopterin oxidoreductase [Phenylobacterium sp.]|uniref:TAT-variant-translocated molybdopterin oxidoreductase n=1 Tax=Phenylobacterium sp. TaxID=1871053 RepID=UPI0025EAC5DB|nr:TAT-variant-translocated molybdopterin oxidoreductase [Phenylobacterium sp.]
MKRRAQAQAAGALAGRTGRRFWRALEELADAPSFRRALRAEFPNAFEGVSDTDRRDVLRVMGASLALAGLGGCTPAPAPDARPYVTQPDQTVLGRPRFYATAVTFDGYAQPVLGETHEGRPTKLEGLPEHPAVRGSADAFTQAAILDLYDPDRSRGPLHLNQPCDWAAFDTAMVENGAHLDATGGEGFRLLTGPATSPTLARQVAALLRRWPRARWHVHDPAGGDLRREATRFAFGRPLDALPRLDRCAAIVSFDDDLLGPGPRQTANARDWSAARKAFQADGEPCRLLVAEPAPTLTGAIAGERLVASADETGLLLRALAARFSEGPEPSLALTARQVEWLNAAEAALRAAPGAALVTAGPWCDPAAQALALRLTARLGGLGRTLSLVEPIQAWPDGDGSLAALVADMAAGRVDTLAILDANPAYSAPADLGFAAALRKVRLRIHAGLHADETATLCHWHAPLAHDLESWSDARAVDGRPSLIQPLVQPFYSVRARSAVLENLQGRLDANPRDLLVETWRARLGDWGDPRWNAALAAGFLDQPAGEVSASPTAAPPPSSAPRAEGLTVLVRPDPCLWDGARANNPWLQELPKPFTKLTWDNAVLVAPALAASAKLKNGDVVRLGAAGREITGPVWVVPGLHRRTVLVHTGYGRRAPRQLCDGRGFDATPLRTAASPWRLDGARLERTGRRAELASTQLNTALDGFDFVRTTSRADVAPAPPPEPPPTLYPEKVREGPQWGMAVDTDLCIGCNACVTACDAENNVAMVGKAQVAKGREMHWMRIDQYHEGPPDDPQLFNQPVPCMHCEEAPCEMGCPVNATVHSHDGLNLQVYNRCIGTRTCSSFCPYKVRRFNWFDFTGDDPPERQAARNPEVTVRDRGVMEKCTYCVQRIEKARIQAKVENRPLRDGEVRTACQQTCPTEAIVFGDVSDPDSAVSRLKAQRRNYALLEEVGTRPRTTYLARLADRERGDG